MFTEVFFEHMNTNSKSDYIFVTFASWAADDPVFFGKSLLDKDNIEGFLIAQTDSNHWYHTQEMSQIAKLVVERKKETGKKVVLYGSSMGGYAAIHYRNLFNADISIAIAPQIFIDKKNSYYENRWSEDLEFLQDKMVFSEIDNLHVQSGKLFVFYDPLHDLDNNHIETYKKLIDSEADFIKVPYASHDLARFLHKASMLKKVIYQICEKREINNEFICILNNLYLEDHKTFFNYFRSKSTLDDQSNEELLQKMEHYLRDIESLDFEALYMAAETLSNLGRHKEAVDLSIKSIESYKIRFNKDAPEYLYGKHDFILRRSSEQL